MLQISRYKISIIFKIKASLYKIDYHNLFFQSCLRIVKINKIFLILENKINFKIKATTLLNKKIQLQEKILYKKVN